jgi:peptide/nickel transport system substrate-binding protein
VIGTNRAPANFGIVRTTMRNVPDEMPNTAFYLTPGPTNPETWFYGAAKS